MKSYVLEVLASNSYHRRHLILNSTQDMIKMGFRPESVRSVACFQKPVLKGFHITSVPLTTGTIPGQQEIIDCYRTFPALFNLRHHPVIGEIREGFYAGQCIALFTQMEIREHFSLDAVRQSVKRHVPHLQVKWRAAKNYAEAEPYYRRPDRQVILNVLRDRYTFSTLTLTESDHIIFRKKIERAAHKLREWYTADYIRVSPMMMPRLAEIYNLLVIAMRCEGHYDKLIDVLELLRAILVQHVYMSDRLIPGKINALERIANGR